MPFSPPLTRRHSIKALTLGHQSKERASEKRNSFILSLAEKLSRQNYKTVARKMIDDPVEWSLSVEMIVTLLVERIYFKVCTVNDATVFTFNLSPEKSLCHQMNTTMMNNFLDAGISSMSDLEYMSNRNI